MIADYGKGLASAMFKELKERLYWTSRHAVCGPTTLPRHRPRKWACESLAPS